MTFLLDGGVNNNLLSNTVVFNPNPETVDEFRVLTSNYNAEYGRSTGAEADALRSEEQAEETAQQVSRLRRMVVKKG